MAAGRKTNWFAIWVSIAVAAVVIVAGIVVVVINSTANDPGEVPQASNIESETGAILVGDGAGRMDTYLDFMCPVCNQFEQIFGEEIEGLVDDGTITLGIHPISILDRASQGTEFSTRAANAMYCVAVEDAEASLPFQQAMFANQPDEATPGLSDEELLAIAAGVGVTGIDACVTDQRYAKYVGAMTQQTPPQPGASGIGTPTIAINGEVIANSDLPAPGQLGTLFE